MMIIIVLLFSLLFIIVIMITNDNTNVDMQTIVGLHSNLAQADRRGVKMSSARVQDIFMH